MVMSDDHLSQLHYSWAGLDFLSGKTVLSAHSLPVIDSCPSLTSESRENSRRKDSMINSDEHEIVWPNRIQTL